MSGEALHTFPLRVYYEDTDLAGIVYYANYLKFIERARSEWIRGLGIDQSSLRGEAGLVFAVRRVVADYVSPARFDDVLTVATTVVSDTGARMVLKQHVLRGDTLLFSAEITLVCLTSTGKATRFPAVLRATLRGADSR